MPREEKQFCGRCSHLLAPARRKRAQTGERLGVRTVDYGRVCMKCIDRHGLTPVNENTPTPTPAPAPAPAEALDAAQVALNALPEWIKRDGAAYGRARLEVAADEAAGKNGTKGAATRVTVPAPVARDIKEAPEPARPVRRPARPRRETSPTALAAVAPASDTYDMAALDRMHGTQTGAPAPRPWAQEMPGPSAPTRRAVAREKRHPRRASTAEERRQLAEAYAAKFGTTMAPRSRRPIVTSAEILADVDNGAAAHPSTEVVGQDAAAAYLGVERRLLKKWAQLHDLPFERRGGGRSAAVVYRSGDLDALLAAVRETEKQTAGQRARVEKPKTRMTTEEYAQARREKTRARLEVIVQALDEGKSPQEAAAAGGYKDTATARTSAARAGREDIRARLLINPAMSAALKGRAA